MGIDDDAGAAFLWPDVMHFLKLTRMKYHVDYELATLVRLTASDAMVVIFDI